MPVEPAPKRNLAARDAECVAEEDDWFCTDACDHAAGQFMCEMPLHPYIDRDGTCVCGLRREAHRNGD